MKHAQLTSLQIKKAKEPGHYCDGSGLWLQISKSLAKDAEPGAVSKSWVFRYTSPISGKVRETGIGSLLTFSVAEAREIARDLRQQVARGVDPIEVRRTKRAERRRAEATSMTFAQCAAEYYAEHADSFTNAKHRKQWQQSLERANAAFGKLDVGDIDVDVLVKFLTPIWRQTQATANRIRGRVEAVLDWATARKFRTGENPARWKGHLEHLLRALPKTTAHHAAMGVDALPEFVAMLRSRDVPSARALEFLILTAVRTGEAIGARWDEIDATGVWTIPAERMKAKRDHRVPLSSRALEIVKGLPRIDGCEFLFPGVQPGTHMNEHSLRNYLRLILKVTDATVHGFRSTFSDWARDRTSYPRDVVEMALAHSIRNKSEAAYRRGDALPKRKALMQDWSKYCAGPVAMGEVVQFKGTSAA